MSLSLPPLRCVLLMDLCPWGRCGWGGMAPLELWMEVRRGCGLASGGHTPIHPQHFRQAPKPPPPPPPSIPSLSSLPKQSPSTRGVRLDEGDWSCVSLSFGLSALLFLFLSCYTFLLISLFLSLTDFCWGSQNDRGPLSRNWSADVGKTRLRHSVSRYSFSENYQKYSAFTQSASLAFVRIISQPEKPS